MGVFLWFSCLATAGLVEDGPSEEPPTRSVVRFVEETDGARTLRLWRRPRAESESSDPAIAIPKNTDEVAESAPQSPLPSPPLASPERSNARPLAPPLEDLPAKPDPSAKVAGFAKSDEPAPAVIGIAERLAKLERTGPESRGVAGPAPAPPTLPSHDWAPEAQSAESAGRPTDAAPAAKGDEPKLPLEIIRPSRTLKTELRSGLVIKSDREITRAEIVDGAVCQVVRYTTHELAILGRQPGRTTLLLWFSDAPRAEAVGVQIAAGVGAEPPMLEGFPMPWDASPLAEPGAVRRAASQEKDARRRPTEASPDRPTSEAPAAGNILARAPGLAAVDGCPRRAPGHHDRSDRRPHPVRRAGCRTADFSASGGRRRPSDPRNVAIQAIAAGGCFSRNSSRSCLDTWAKRTWRAA